MCLGCGRGIRGLFNKHRYNSADEADRGVGSWYITDFVRGPAPVDYHHDKNMRTTKGIPSSVDFMIINHKDDTRPIKYSYVGYGSELARIDVEAAKKYKAQRSHIGLEDLYDFQEKIR